MKYVDHDILIDKNERIENLLSELNSTLDLYYDLPIEKEVVSNEHLV